MPNVGLTELVLITSALLIPGVLLFALWRKSRFTPLESWAAAHQVVLTERTREVVSSHLQRTLRWRLLGASLGAILPLGTKVPGMEMIAGYLLGAIFAEISARPAFDEGAHGTAVAPRFVGTYIPRNVLFLFRALCGGALLVAASSMVIPLRADGAGTGTPLLFVSAGAILLLAVVETALHYIATRRQNGDTREVIDADDALRASAMHTTLGAGLGLAFLLLGMSALGLSIAADVQFVRWAGIPFLLVSFSCAVASWFRLGPDTPWSVRRLDDHKAHA